jgi:prophage antirepressor-like protein
MDDQNPQAAAPKTENLPVEFRFKDLVVRTVSKNEEPWFVAADVCKALEIKNTTRAIAPLDDDEKGLYQVKTLGGAQDLNVVNEFGLYRLILRSDKAKAKAFQRWVIHEVLPSIRKTGRYEAAQQPALDRSHRGFEEILVGEFIDPDALLQILFGEKIPFSGHEKFGFLAGPTCAALGLRDRDEALDLLPESEQGLVTIYTPHGPERQPAITEAAMYYLAFTPRNRPDVFDCARAGHGAGIRRPFERDDHIDGLNLRLLAMLTTKLDFHWASFRPRQPALDDADPLLRDFESALRAAATLAAEYVDLGFDPK